ncbi:MAG: polysaccharide deacetylase family protein [bacterium]
MVKALQFHRIVNHFQFCGTWNTPEQLDSFINTIYKSGYNIVLPGEGRDGLIITFDDGEENLYHFVLPILRKYRCPAMVFLIVDYIGKENLWDISLINRRSRHLNWQQILEMKDAGVTFGSHTMTHRNLTRLSQHDLVYEIFESKSILEKYLGTIDAISYPFNRINETVVQFVKKAGYKYGFGGYGYNNLTIKKEAIYITDNHLTLNIKISETPPLLYRYVRLQQKVINYFTIATMLKRLNING